MKFKELLEYGMQHPGKNSSPSKVVAKKTMNYAAKTAKNSGPATAAAASAVTDQTQNTKIKNNNEPELKVGDQVELDGEAASVEKIEDDGIYVKTRSGKSVKLDPDVEVKEGYLSESFSGLNLEEKLLILEDVEINNGSAVPDRGGDYLISKIMNSDFKAGDHKMLMSAYSALPVPGMISEVRQLLADQGPDADASAIFKNYVKRFKPQFTGS